MLSMGFITILDGWRRKLSEYSQIHNEMNGKLDIYCVLVNILIKKIQKGAVEDAHKLHKRTCNKPRIASIH